MADTFVDGIRLSGFEGQSAGDGVVLMGTKVDNTLTKAGQAADAKKVGDELASASDDITALQSGKANVDGYYADLVSGGATQILSDMVETDTTPYNYRTAGGSLEIGDRMKLKKIVGGSLAVNQLAKALVEGNYNKGSGTAVYDNGTVSFTAGARYGALYCATIKELVEYHKYLISAKIKMTSQPSADTVRLGVGNTGYNQGAIYVPSTASVTSFTEISGVVQYSYGTYPTDNYLFLQDNRAEASQIDMKDLMLIDLTQMFGTTIADYLYNLEQTTAGAGVAWFRKLFPKDYYESNAGELLSVSGLQSHDMAGFNQWDEEWEVGAYSSVDGAKTSAASDRIRSKNFIPVVPSTTYYKTKGLQIYYYDADHNFVNWNSSANAGTFTTPSYAHYMTFNGLANSGVTYNHDICINLHWDGERDGEYEPYEEHSYALDSDVTLRGIYKLDANNSLYADGDEYEADGTVTRRYGIVDLGTLTFTRWGNDGNTFASTVDGINTTSQNIACDTYTPLINGSTVWAAIVSHDMTIYNPLNDVYLLIRDTRYTDAATFKAAMSGVYLVYELATPTTEEADPYTEIQNVSNWGTEEFVSESLVPVGHVTEYQPDLRAKIEVAPESPDTDGLYLMKRENGQNSYVAYLGELPSDPTTDGTYTLKCTVASGTATKTWEADE